MSCKKKKGWGDKQGIDSHVLYNISQKCICHTTSFEHN